MSENKKGTAYDGFQPKENIERGYQPQYIPTGDPNPQGGYIPTSKGENPTNIPPPPGDE
jgi:hypothetical protein